MQGRANKLLGRAGAAQARHGQKSLSGLGRPGSTPLRAPEAFVFEGHRASSKQGTSGLKLGGSGRKKGGKPKTRSSKRGAAWKASSKSKPGK
jgi:nucleolar protein 12